MLLLTGWLHDAANVDPLTPVLEAGRGSAGESLVKVPIAFTALIVGVSS